MIQSQWWWCFFFLHLVPAVLRQSTSLKDFYGIADFITLGSPDAQVLLVAESFSAPAQLTVLDMSQDNFDVPRLFNTTVCHATEDKNLMAYQFLPLNVTSCILHCADVLMREEMRGVNVISALFILTWNPQWKNITVSSSYGYYPNGWLFTMPAPSYSYPPPNGTQALVAMTDNTINAASARIDIINISTWGFTKQEELVPGLNPGSSLVLNASVAVVGGGYSNLLQYLDLNTMKRTGVLAGPTDVSYALCGSTQNSALVLVNDGVKHLWITVQRMRDAPHGPALNISFKQWTIYASDDTGRNTAGFSPDEKTVFILVESDPGPVVMYILGIDSSPPKLLGTVNVFYEYVHNVVVSDSWVYLDTDNVVMSRFQYPVH